MFSISELVFSVLNGYAPLKLLIDKISPIVAAQESGKKLVNYTIEKLSKYTKDASGDFRITIDCWAEKYDDTLKIADEVYEAIGASNETFIFINSKPFYSDEGVYFTRSVYELKK